MTYCVQNGNDGQIEAHLSMNPPNDKSNLLGPPVGILYYFRDSLNILYPQGTEDGILQLLDSSANDDGIYCKVGGQFYFIIEY